MASARLQAIYPEFQGTLALRWRAFPLEIINEQPAPQHIVDQEWPLVTQEEPLAMCRPWNNVGYPTSTYLTFEAYACAYTQDPALAFEFDYRIRRAFFYDSQWIHLRHVLLRLAQEVGLDLDQMRQDLDTGRYKVQVIDDYRLAMRMREVGHAMTSPTLVLPHGGVYPNPFACEKTVTEQGRVRILAPPTRTGEAALDGYRALLRQALDARATVQERASQPRSL